MGMLNKEDMATALVTNLENQRWDTNPVYQLDEENGLLVANIIREYWKLSAENEELNKRIDANKLLGGAI